MVLPDFQSFTEEIRKIYNKVKQNRGGSNATYIPQLAKVDINYFGVALCTIDGQRFSIGDADVAFPIQSCSKPLMYALALEKLTPAVVHSYVGHEPSGKNFNELVLNSNNKPHNPMINSGAILITSLLITLVHPEMPISEKFSYIQDFLKRMAGGDNFGFNNSVFLSEREAADRNYALGFYMREHKVFPENSNLRECLDFYFQVSRVANFLNKYYRMILLFK